MKLRVILAILGSFFLSGCRSVLDFLGVNVIRSTGDPEIYPLIGKMEALGDGKTPIVIRDGRLTIDVEFEVNGNIIPGFFLIDTGLAESFVDYSVINYFLTENNKTQYLFWQIMPYVSIPARGRGQIIGPVSAQGFRINAGLWRVLDFTRLGDLSFFIHFDTEDVFFGMLGRDILLQKPVKFDFPRMSFNLTFDPEDLAGFSEWQQWDGGKRNPDWTMPQAAFWDSKGQHPVIFDTGAVGSFMPVAVVRDLATRKPASFLRVDAINAQRQPLTRISGVLENVNFAESGNALNFSDLYVISHDWQNRDYTIGMQVLHEYILVIDSNEKKIFLKHETDIGEEVSSAFALHNIKLFGVSLDTSPNFGFSITQESGGFLVTGTIRLYTHLDAPRPTPGDYLVAVNGTPARSPNPLAHLGESAEFTFRKANTADQNYSMILQKFYYDNHVLELVTE